MMKNLKFERCKWCGKKGALIFSRCKDVPRKKFVYCVSCGSVGEPSIFKRLALHRWNHPKKGDIPFTKEEKRRYFGT